MEQKFVVFQLADELYGFPIEAVERILPDQAITRIPRTPSMFLGVFDLRGETLPAIDLRQRFDREKNESDKANLVVVSGQYGRVALRVDGLDGIVNLSADDISSDTSFVSNSSDDFLKGIGKDGDRLIVLLDSENVVPANLRKTVLKVAA